MLHIDDVSEPDSTHTLARKVVSMMTHFILLWEVSDNDQDKIGNPMNTKQYTNTKIIKM